MVRWLGEYWHLGHRFADAVGWIDQALDRPDADAHPELCVRALLAKVGCLWPPGRRTETPAVIEAAATIADERGDPALIARVFYWRSRREAVNGHLERGTALAHDALRWASKADEWEIAMAHHARALAAPTLADLRELVDQAARRLSAVGNVVELASLLGSAAYSALWEGSDRDAKAFLDQAEPIARMLDDPAILMMVHGNTGLTAALTGDTEGARQAFREELELCRKMVFLPFAYEGLLGLATVATVDGDIRRAARLVGAAHAYRYGQPKDPVDGRLDAAFFNPARARYGTHTWDAAAREGAALSFGDAITYALEEPQARAPRHDAAP
jgi:hypothetical protein